MQTLPRGNLRRHGRERDLRPLPCRAVLRRRRQPIMYGLRPGIVLRNDWKHGMHALCGRELRRCARQRRVRTLPPGNFRQYDGQRRVCRVPGWNLRRRDWQRRVHELRTGFVRRCHG